MVGRSRYCRGSRYARSCLAARRLVGPAPGWVDAWPASGSPRPAIRCAVGSRRPCTRGRGGAIKFAGGRAVNVTRLQKFRPEGRSRRVSSTVPGCQAPPVCVDQRPPPRIAVRRLTPRDRGPYGLRRISKDELWARTVCAPRTCLGIGGQIGRIRLHDVLPHGPAARASARGSRLLWPAGRQRNVVSKVRQWLAVAGEVMVQHDMRRAAPGALVGLAAIAVSCAGRGARSSRNPDMDRRRRRQNGPGPWLSV